MGLPERPDIPTLDETLLFTENGLPTWWPGSEAQLHEHVEPQLPENPNAQDVVNALRLLKYFLHEQMLTREDLCPPVPDETPDDE